MIDLDMRSWHHGEEEDKLKKRKDEKINVRKGKG